MKRLYDDYAACKRKNKAGNAENGLYIKHGKSQYMKERNFVSSLTMHGQTVVKARNGSMGKSAMIKVQVINKEGTIIAEAAGTKEVNLPVSRIYEEGDRVVFFGR